jgi:hypothetical protein
MITMELLLLERTSMTDHFMPTWLSVIAIT